MCYSTYSVPVTAAPRHPLLTALSERVLVADGAMGTMLQAQDPSLDDFAGLEGCNEILNVTRPDIVRAVHRAYLEVGVDAIETNTFGANLANLAEYDIPDRIYELSRAGAALARAEADEFSTPDHPRFVLGSVGPGTKLPTLGHAGYVTLRDAYQQEVAGLLDGGARGRAGRRDGDGEDGHVDHGGGGDVAVPDCDVGVALFSKDFPQPMAGASNKPFDFMSCGLPLLTTDSPEWRDFYATFGISLFCDPESAADIAEKIRWFGDNREVRYEMARRSHDLIRTVWNYERDFSPVLSALDGTTFRTGT